MGKANQVVSLSRQSVNRQDIGRQDVVASQGSSKCINDLINDEYENSIRKLKSMIRKSKHDLTGEEDKEEEMKIKELETRVQNYMTEFRKLIKEAKQANTSTSTVLRNYHCTLMKCEELCKIELDEIDKETHILLDGIVTEINNACKSVYL